MKLVDILYFHTIFIRCIHFVRFSFLKLFGTSVYLFAIMLYILMFIRPLIMGDFNIDTFFSEIFILLICVQDTHIKYLKICYNYQ